MVDRETLTEWWTKLEPVLLAMAVSRSRSRELAEDLVYEIAITVLKKPERFPSYEALLHWATRTLRYRILDAVMASARPVGVGWGVAWELPSQEERVLLSEVVSKLDELPERQREALRGVLYGESPEQTAARLGVTPATVRSLQRFARLRLAEKFED